LIGNIAASLSQVSREDIIERSVGHFRKADHEFGDRVAEAVAQRRMSRTSRGLTPQARENGRR
jgi:catalase